MDGEKLITVIVPQGRGMPLLQALHERRTVRAALGSARAPSPHVGRTGALAGRIPLSVEKDVLSVVVAADDADDVFNLLVERAQIAETPGGFIYVGDVARASPFTLEW